MSPTILICPGLGNSGPQHWQSLWQARRPMARRLEHADWNTPVLADWCDALEAAVVAAPGPVVLVAHSLACSLVAHWAGSAGAGTSAVLGALLVAPADVESPERTPPEVHTFAPIPRAPLPFPTILVASRNDPYMAFDKAQDLAWCWGADCVDVGEAGHINAAAGYGEWPEGELLLDDLLTRA